jgi:hypothetical protein
MCLRNVGKVDHIRLCSIPRMKLISIIPLKSWNSENHSVPKAESVSILAKTEKN